MNASVLRLRFTASLTVLLLLAPGLALWRLPRPRALGLERLLPHVALLQSLPAATGRAVPRFWSERLGEPLAQRLWGQQRGMWWQTWGRHGDGDAYLVLPLSRRSALTVAQKPANSLLFDDLLVVAADPLSLRLLEDQLRARQRPVRGLERRCLSLLQQQEAVFWKSAGLGGISGALAPLLFGYQEGCLALQLQGSSLRFRGEASGNPDDPALTGPPRSVSLAPSEPLNAPLLLELRGASLQPLVQGLLARQLVRQALARRYGIGAKELDLLRRVPFQLRLRPLERGAFRAGLELELEVGARREPWLAMLRGLNLRIQESGLQQPAPRWTGAASPATLPLPPTAWRREDGTVVGGWFWRSLPGRQPALVLFLGPEPPVQAPPRSSPALTGAMRLRLRPAAMASAGLLPAEMPRVVRQASQLQIEVGPAQGALSPLSGSLHLERRPQPR